jgi:hypothetical protein
MMSVVKEITKELYLKLYIMSSYEQSEAITQSTAQGRIWKITKLANRSSIER